MRCLFFSLNWDRGSIPALFNHFFIFIFIFIFFIQFNVPFKIISLIETSQSIGWAKREFLDLRMIKPPCKYCAEKKADDKMLYSRGRG